jgi:hypothetical protein
VRPRSKVARTDLERNNRNHRGGPHGYQAEARCRRSQSVTASGGRG